MKLTLDRSLTILILALIILLAIGINIKIRSMLKSAVFSDEKLVKDMEWRPDHDYKKSIPFNEAVYDPSAIQNSVEGAMTRFSAVFFKEMEDNNQTQVLFDITDTAVEVTWTYKDHLKSFRRENYNARNILFRFQHMADIPLDIDSDTEGQVKVKFSHGYISYKILYRHPDGKNQGKKIQIIRMAS